jgi:hypothetical protein
MTTLFCQHTISDQTAFHPAGGETTEENKV